MSLNFCMKTFVFVVQNERTKPFSMFIKKYSTLNANTIKKQKNLFKNNYFQCNENF